MGGPPAVACAYVSPCVALPQRKGAYGDRACPHGRTFSDTSMGARCHSMTCAQARAGSWCAMGRLIMARYTLRMILAAGWQASKAGREGRQPCTAHVSSQRPSSMHVPGEARPLTPRLFPLMIRPRTCQRDGLERGLDRVKHGHGVLRVRRRVGGRHVSVKTRTGPPSVRLSCYSHPPGRPVYSWPRPLMACRTVLSHPVKSGHMCGVMHRTWAAWHGVRLRRGSVRWHPPTASWTPCSRWRRLRHGQQSVRQQHITYQTTAK